MSDDLELAERIHEIVSVLQDYSAKFDELIKTDDEAFIFPKKALEALKGVVDTNIFLVTKLFEDSQALTDGIEKAIEKAKHQKES